MINSLKILIYGINFSPELVGIGKYTGEMATWLSANGHKVQVVTALPYYPEWKIHSQFSKWGYAHDLNDGLTVWRCPLYVPSKPRALLRIIHLASFALTSFPILIFQIFWRPNVVFLVAPTLFCAPGALLLSRLTRAKSILHIQDFEVDALFGLDLVSSASAFKKLAFSFESFLLRKFDIISTISSGMIQRALDKGVAKDGVRFLANWSEISRFQNIEPSRELLRKLGVPENKKIILYSGNMGEKQGLDGVILAAQKLQIKKDLIFVLVGDGASRNRLVNMVLDLNLSNVVFCPLQSYDDLPVLLASAHVHLVVQRRGAADSVLPSKLSNILAVGGNAVITADAATTLGSLAFEHPGIALVVEPESIDALVWGIERALIMPRPNNIAKNYAKEFLDKEQVLSKFFQNIEAQL